MFAKMRLEMFFGTHLWVKSVRTDIFHLNTTRWAWYFPKVGEWVTQCDQDQWSKSTKSGLGAMAWQYWAASWVDSVWLRIMSRIFEFWESRIWRMCVCGGGGGGANGMEMMRVDRVLELPRDFEYWPQPRHYPWIFKVPGAAWVTLDT